MPLIARARLARRSSVVFGLPAIVIAIAILLFVRERGTDRAAAIAQRQRPGTRSGGSSRDRDLRWLYLTSVLGGGGRGLGVVNLFALLYLTEVLGAPRGDVRADVRRR